ncbi:MAG: hypothetical protein AAGJ82_09855, partial [Bacteroidota bacterium]
DQNRPFVATFRTVLALIAMLLDSVRPSISTKIADFYLSQTLLNKFTNIFGRLVKLLVPFTNAYYKP